MSDLINNLNSIYNTKLAIKEVIGTDSDNFSEYPSLIEEAISGGVSGYSYIIANGDYDISTYEMVNVNVPVPPGYILPEGTMYVDSNTPNIEWNTNSGRIQVYPDPDISTYSSLMVNIDPNSIPGWTLYHDPITANGKNIEVIGYTLVNVNVPIDWNAVENTYGYVLPTGSYTATSNGIFDISAYQNVIVDTPIHGDGTLNNPYDFTYLYSMTGESLIEINKYFKAIVCSVSQGWIDGEFDGANGYVSADGSNSGDRIEFNGVEPPCALDNLPFDSDTMTQIAVGQEVIIRVGRYHPGDHYIGGQYVKKILSPTSNQLNITSNGTYSVQDYVSTYVNVQSSPVSIVPDTFQAITKAELEATTVSDPIFAYTQRILYTYNISGTHVGEYTAQVSGANFVDIGVQWYDEEVPTGSDGSLYYFSGNNPNIRNNTRTISDNGYYRITNNDPIQNYGDIYINVSGGGPSTTTVSGQYLIGKGGSSDEYTINRGFYYVYDSNTSTYYTLTQALGNPMDKPKLGDTVSVTGTILSGNIITPTSYSVTAVPTYEYVDLSNFELFGTGDKETAYVVNGVGISDRITTYDNKWGYNPGGDYYNIIADSVSNVSFTAGNDITAYIVSEAVEEDGYYGYTYYIRDIVINRSPIITGLEYSADHGENWTSATFDPSEMVYNINGLSISEYDMVGLYLRADIGGGNYLYLGDVNLEINNIGVDVSDSLNKSRNYELSTGIMNQTGSAGTVSATISTVNSTISARITA